MIDTFAAGEYENYVYSGSSAGATSGPREGSIAGVDFSYRLLASRVGERGENFKKQLWVYGETIHGVSSVDINCSSNKNLPSCAQTLSGITTPANPGDSYLYILRNAGSLEGYLGFRYEFARLNDWGGLDPDGTPATLYVKAQAGFLKVAGSPGSALDVDKIAAGIIATKGNFTGSYVEVGFGRNDAFQFNRRRRAIVDGYLQRKLPPIAGRGRDLCSVEMIVDTDLGRGSDSFQTCVGVNLDLGSLF